MVQGDTTTRNPPITRPDGSRAIQPEEEAQAFADAFFPAPPLVETGQYDPWRSLPRMREFLDVTKNEIDELRTTSNTSAPGISGLSYRALKRAWISRGPLIRWIIKWSIKAGFHHPSWKKALMVAIPKPNKPNFRSPKPTARSNY